MVQKDAQLFLSWAAEAFVAAGRATEAEQRHHHRRQAELFYDIFQALKRRPDIQRSAKEPHEVGQLLGTAFMSDDDDSRR